MGRFWIACRAFYRALFFAADAELIAAALSGEKLPKVDVEAKSQPTPSPARPAQPEPPRRSDAITLLAALQREARLIDLVQEPLASYSDEQIGAAARNVLGDAAKVLDRFFSLRRAVPQNEGDAVEVPASYDAARYHLTGNVATPPFRGKLAHAGWEAATVTLPTWTGSKESSLVIAPAEVEVL